MVIKLAAAALWLVVTLSCASGERCECTTFFLGDVKEEHMVYAVPDTNIEDCADPGPCKESCAQTFRKLTKDGDLSHVTSKGISVAQLSCKIYRKNIKNGVLAAHYRTCGGDWKVAVQMDKVLCCEKGAAVDNC